MDREQQQMDKTISNIEEEVMDKLNRRAEDRQGFNDDQDESTVIVSKLARAPMPLPRSRNTAIIVALSLLLLAVLIVLIAIMLRLIDI